MDEKLPDITLSHSERALFIRENDVTLDHDAEVNEQRSEKDNRTTGGGVHIVFDLSLLTSCSLDTRSRSTDRLCGDN